jgi:hypothetical protein
MREGRERDWEKGLEKDEERD